MEIRFEEWLVARMAESNMSQSELAKKAGITQSAISLILSGTRNPGLEMCTGIARALRLPPEEVFRAAGILPPVTPRTALIQKIEHIVSELPPEEQQNILDFALHRHEIAEKRGERHAKKTSENPALSGSA